MQFTQLGSSGVTVSRLALGAMTFGDYSFAGFQADVDKGTADQMVGLALEAGVNLFDTAEGYGGGQSEEILGAALRRAGALDRALISTKVIAHAENDSDSTPGRLDSRHVVAAAEAALRRLGVDRIDLYQLYVPDLGASFEDALRALDDLVSRGLVRHVGWSNLPAWYAARAEGIQRSHDWAPFVCAQIHYSLVGRDAEHELLPYCQAAGLGTVIWSPLAGGFLTGKYTREDPSGGGGRRASFSVPPIDLERGYDVIEVIRGIAEQHHVPVAHVAYAWLLSKPAVSSVIVGASTPQQLADNLLAADLTLSEAEIAALDAIGSPRPIYPDPRWMTGERSPGSTSDRPAPTARSSSDQA